MTFTATLDKSGYASPFRFIQNWTVCPATDHSRFICASAGSHDRTGYASETNPFHQTRIGTD